MIAIQSLTVDNIIGLVIAVVLTIYLIVALIIPEKF